VARIFVFGHEGSGMAGSEVYKTGRPANDEGLKSRDGVVAESWEDKAELIKEEAFPKPLKGVEKNAQEEGGGMWKTITDEDI
jgi:hypothetical protein